MRYLKFNKKKIQKHKGGLFLLLCNSLTYAEESLALVSTHACLFTDFNKKIPLLYNQL